MGRGFTWPTTHGPRDIATFLHPHTHTHTMSLVRPPRPYPSIHASFPFVTYVTSKTSPHPDRPSACTTGDTRRSHARTPTPSTPSLPPRPSRYANAVAPAATDHTTAVTLSVSPLPTFSPYGSVHDAAHFYPTSSTSASTTLTLPFLPLPDSTDPPKQRLADPRLPSLPTLAVAKRTLGHQGRQTCRISSPLTLPLPLLWTLDDDTVPEQARKKEAGMQKPATTYILGPQASPASTYTSTRLRKQSATSTRRPTTPLPALRVLQRPG